MDKPQAVVEQTSLEHCPVCNYHLTGLPARHRCPECGFAFDEHTRVWRSEGFGRFAGWVTAMCVFALLAALHGLLNGNPTWFARFLLGAVVIAWQLLAG